MIAYEAITEGKKEEKLKDEEIEEEGESRYHLSDLFLTSIMGGIGAYQACPMVYGWRFWHSKCHVLCQYVPARHYDMPEFDEFS